MNEHTITVDFDDSDVDLDAIVQALNGAGYTVPGHERIDN